MMTLFISGASDSITICSAVSVESPCLRWPYQLLRNVCQHLVRLRGLEGAHKTLYLRTQSGMLVSSDVCLQI